jgi:hypothetical protein
MLNTGFRAGAVGAVSHFGYEANKIMQLRPGKIFSGCDIQDKLWNRLYIFESLCKHMYLLEKAKLYS